MNKGGCSIESICLHSALLMVIFFNVHCSDSDFASGLKTQTRQTERTSTYGPSVLFFGTEAYSTWWALDDSSYAGLIYQCTSITPWFDFDPKKRTLRLHWYSGDRSEFVFDSSASCLWICDIVGHYCSYGSALNVKSLPLNSIDLDSVRLNSISSDGTVGLYIFGSTIYLPTMNTFRQLVSVDTFPIWGISLNHGVTPREMVVVESSYVALSNYGYLPKKNIIVEE